MTPPLPGVDAHTTKISVGFDASLALGPLGRSASGEVLGASEALGHDVHDLLADARLLRRDFAERRQPARAG